jgi:hypothetical protein
LELELKVNNKIWNLISVLVIITLIFTYKVCCFRIWCVVLQGWYF